MIWEFVTSKDFAVNIAAGLVIFMLDVVLIVLLLPRVVQRRIDARWQDARKDLAGLLSDSCYDLTERIERLDAEQGDLGAMFKELQKFEESLRTAPAHLSGQISLFTPCFDARLTKLVSDFLTAYRDLTEGMRLFVMAFHFGVDVSALEELSRTLGAKLLDLSTYVDRKDSRMLSRAAQFPQLFAWHASGRAEAFKERRLEHEKETAPKAKVS